VDDRSRGVRTAGFDFSLVSVLVSLDMFTSSAIWRIFHFAPSISCDPVDEA
jgi:hypothetical protein